MRLINDSDFPILDIQCRGSSARVIARKHSGIDEVHLTIESRGDLTTGLRRVSYNKPLDVERFGQSLDLWRTLGICPLRIPAKPERTAIVDTEPGAVAEKCL